MGSEGRHSCAWLGGSPNPSSKNAFSLRNGSTSGSANGFPPAPSPSPSQIPAADGDAAVEPSLALSCYALMFGEGRPEAAALEERDAEAQRLRHQLRRCAHGMGGNPKVIVGGTGT